MSHSHKHLRVFAVFTDLHMNSYIHTLYYSTHVGYITLAINNEFDSFPTYFLPTADYLFVTYLFCVLISLFHYSFYFYSFLFLFIYLFIHLSICLFIHLFYITISLSNVPNNHKEKAIRSKYF